MKKIELLAKQLEIEAAIHETGATEKTFSNNIRFWELCLKARDQLNKYPLKKVKNDKD